MTAGESLEALVARAPARYRRMYGRALRGELAPRSAIKVKCLECCAWERHDGGQDRIGGCTVRACPLWPLRPFQRATEALEVLEGAASGEEPGAGGLGAVLGLAGNVAVAGASS